VVSPSLPKSRYSIFHHVPTTLLCPQLSSGAFSEMQRMRGRYSLPSISMRLDLPGTSRNVGFPLVAINPSKNDYKRMGHLSALTQLKTGPREHVATSDPPEGLSSSG
jgi:hypothetical protein